jgi:very-short-patch-repair endonuclease
VVDVLHTHGADRRVIALAARQHGLVTSKQLAAAGLGPRSIAHRVAQHRLRRYHRGVYLVASLPAPLTPQMAAVLACGDGAVLSHHAAAALWGIRKPQDGPIDVTVVGEGVRKRNGVRVHRARHLDRRDRTTRDGIPVTAPARTLLDVAPLHPQSHLDRALEEAQVLRLATPRTIQAMLDRIPGHPGAGRLLAALKRQHDPSLTRSEAEARLLELIRKAELPPPQTNVRILGHEVDLVWHAARLIVEVDGFAFHSTRQAFERDRLRDGELQAAGYRVIRVTWRQAAGTPEAVVARLARALTAA